MPIIVVTPSDRTSWCVPAGIHSARDRGRTHIRSPTPIVTSPRDAHASWCDGVPMAPEAMTGR